MKKPIVFFVTWFASFYFVLGNINPLHDPDDWPRHVIRFSEQGTLKDVFDAGIRPYRFPSLERTALGFKHVHVVIETRSGDRLPSVPVEWANLNILDGGLIDNVQMTSHKLSVEEAVAAMTPFLHKGERTAEQLSSFLTSAAADPRGYDDAYHGDASKFITTWNEVNGPNYAVFFKSTFDDKKPVSISLIASFSPVLTVKQRRSFYEIPIPPPPGYENVSMDAPRNFGPDSAVEIARFKGDQITGDQTPIEDLQKTHNADDNHDDPTSNSFIVEVNTESSDLHRWRLEIINFWIIGGIGLFAITIILILSRREKKSQGKNLM